MELRDHYAIDAADVRVTHDGYLVANPRVARTGVQLYRGSEVGMPQIDVVRIYRPEAEVFNKDSLATYAYKPVTNDHPPKPVGAANWKDYSVGSISGEVARDGEYIRVPMLVMDEKTINDVRDGKSELSVGYSTQLRWEKGTAPSGEAYDAIQTAIRVNHVAIVDAARGGPKLKIGDFATSDPHSTADVDANHGDDDMTTPEQKVSLTVDGISLSTDAMTAQVVSKSLKDLNDKLSSSTAQITTLSQQVADAKTAHDAAIAKLTTEHKTAIDAKDAEITTLKKQLEDSKMTPERIEQMVADRSVMLQKAKAILGDKLVADKKSDAEIRRQVVLAKLGDTAKDWSDDQIKISFDTLTVAVQVSPAVADARSAFQQPATQPNDVRDSYAARDKRLADAWKNPNGQPAVQ